MNRDEYAANIYLKTTDSKDNVSKKIDWKISKVPQPRNSNTEYTQTSCIQGENSLIHAFLKSVYKPYQETYVLEHKTLFLESEVKEIIGLFIDENQNLRHNGNPRVPRIFIYNKKERSYKIASGRMNEWIKYLEEWRHAAARLFRSEIAHSLCKNRDTASKRVIRKMFSDSPDLISWIVSELRSNKPLPNYYFNIFMVLLNMLSSASLDHYIVRGCAIGREFEEINPGSIINKHGSVLYSEDDHYEVTGERDAVVITTKDGINFDIVTSTDGTGKTVNILRSDEPIIGMFGNILNYKRRQSR
uniref:Uncharacterized protein n=1 Tax=Pithovirus LCDPAC01 TaxID=2506600 RepID=A0A481YMQ5_9VIRU|nr:MAG: hypothetical protein LCDPAC01_01310 [Pithovirus LCDPAC01]